MVEGERSWDMTFLEKIKKMNPDQIAERAEVRNFWDKGL
jgi:hypothetical protein